MRFFFLIISILPALQMVSLRSETLDYGWISANENDPKKVLLEVEEVAGISELLKVSIREGNGFELVHVSDSVTPYIVPHASLSVKFPQGIGGTDRELVDHYLNMRFKGWSREYLLEWYKMYFHDKKRDALFFYGAHARESADGEKVMVIDGDVIRLYSSANGRIKETSYDSRFKHDTFISKLLVEKFGDLAVDEIKGTDLRAFTQDHQLVLLLPGDFLRFRKSMLFLSKEPYDPFDAE